MTNILVKVEPGELDIAQSILHNESVISVTMETGLEHDGNTEHAGIYADEEAAVNIISVEDEHRVFLENPDIMTQNEEGTDLNEMSQNTSSNEVDTGYFCSLCNKNFQKRWQWNKHKKLKHKKGEAFIFENDEEMELQMSVFICHVCGMDLKKAAELRRHLRLHEEQGIFKCGVCYLQFNDTKSLSDHKKSEQHESLEHIQDLKLKKKVFKRVRFICAYCGKEFYEKSHYQLHCRIHTGERPYTCGVCSKDFAGTGGLREHMKIHTGEKNHVCTECGKGFYGPSKLKSHMRIHTGDRPYKCNYCGKGFIESGKLKRHLRIHTGEQPYSCPVCGRGFNVISNMTKHMIVHTGVKPYPCDICGKAFAQKINMQVHMKTHTQGDKKNRDGHHACGICGETFKKAKDLKSHKKTHVKKTENMEDHIIIENPMSETEDVSVDSTLAKLNDCENFPVRKIVKTGKRKKSLEKFSPQVMVKCEVKSEIQDSEDCDFDLGGNGKGYVGSLLDVANSNELPSNFFSDIQIKSEPLEYDFELESANYMQQFDEASLEGSLEGVGQGDLDSKNHMIDHMTDTSFSGPLSDDLENSCMSLSSHDFRIKMEPLEVLENLENVKSERSNNSSSFPHFASVSELQNDSGSNKGKKGNMKKGTKHTKSSKRNTRSAKSQFSDSRANCDFSCPGCKTSFPSKQKLAVHSISCTEESDWL